MKKSSFNIKDITKDILKLLADKQVELNNVFSRHLELLEKEVNVLKHEINPKSRYIPVIVPPTPPLSPDCQLIEITDEIIAILPKNRNITIFFDIQRNDALCVDQPITKIYYVIEGVEGSEGIFTTLRDKFLQLEVGE